MAMNEPRYWFPAKRHGWGWGFPTTWQGWLVLVVYAGLLILGGLRFPPRAHPAAFVGCVALINGVLFLICYAKGEPPKWRWKR
jgi:hypothetical protein